MSDSDSSIESIDIFDTESSTDSNRSESTDTFNTESSTDSNRSESSEVSDTESSEDSNRSESAEVSDIESSSDSIEEPMPPYECPILHEPCVDPVLLVDDGITYERAAITKWMEDHSTSPSGTVLQTKKLISNLAVKHRITICSFSKEEYRDPIIVEQVGMTYEHDDLVALIKQTLCKYKYICLQGLSWREIRCHSNKALWKDEYAAERKPFTMPEMKIYPGYIHTPETMVRLYAPGSTIDASSFSEGKFNKKIENLVFHYAAFESGCIKGIRLINCYFYRCTFSCCMCSLFKNCRFEECHFKEVMFIDTKFYCRGSAFIDCLFRDKRDTRCGARECEGGLDALLLGAQIRGCVVYPDPNHEELTEQYDRQIQDREIIRQTMSP